ncbi:alpha/beta hydrolase [Mycobacterium vicinigordonae]|uniref:Alpha/beta hydrolase n=1 Tax=Mycobacterium vicinigordonae TaxID=1719132 RepID=A0A7D6I773_9MYCO|nr:alpha/beta hydrolase [Mycobacterium vicinigordonae]QLL07396.1 alpha/beta hydrolase [Mycobacterium vicinigordonae]
MAWRWIWTAVTPQGASESESLREHLAEFMRTMRPPKGHSTVEFLRTADKLINAELPTVGKHHAEVAIGTIGEWQLKADILIPQGSGPHPTLLFLHGGSWSMGSPKTHRRLTRDLAAAGMLTISLDYRRAPQYRFPDPVDDALTALQWTYNGVAAYGGDPGRIAIGGDSAGANIAAGALTVTDRPAVGAALFLYGVFDYHATIESLARPGRAAAEQQLYVTPSDYERRRSDPRLSPILAPECFPPTYLTAGADDPTVAESLRMAVALGEAGVPHELVIVEDMPHGFLQLPHLAGHDERISAAASFVANTLADITPKRTEDDAT